MRTRRPAVATRLVLLAQVLVGLSVGLQAALVHSTVASTPPEQTNPELPRDAASACDLTVGHQDGGAEGGVLGAQEPKGVPTLDAAATTAAVVAASVAPVDAAATEGEHYADNGSATATAAATPTSKEALLLELLSAELKEVDEVLRVAQRKQDVLARARQAVLATVQQQQHRRRRPSGPGSDGARAGGPGGEVSVAELIAALIAEATSPPPTVPTSHPYRGTHPAGARPPSGAAAASPWPEATAVTGFGAPPGAQQHHNHYEPQFLDRRQSFEELVLLKAEVVLPAAVVEVIVLPLAIYNPYSRSMSSGADKAPHPELVLVVNAAGSALFFSSDGVQVANITVGPHPTAADYTFTQSQERTVVGALDAAGELRLYQFNAWYDHFPLLGATVPVHKNKATAEGRLVVDLRVANGDRVRVATAPNAYVDASVPFPVGMPVGARRYTVALTPVLRTPLAAFDVDPRQLLLYSWRANVYAVATTRNGTSLLFVNKTGHMRATIDMTRLLADTRGGDIATSGTGPQTAAAADADDTAAPGEEGAAAAARIVRYVQLGPRLAIAFGNTVYFYHVERRGFENTRCVGLARPLLDFAFDAVSPAHIYASVEGGGVLVFDVTGRPDAPNPCVILRIVGRGALDTAAAEAGVVVSSGSGGTASASAMAGRGADWSGVDSVPGYLLHVRSDAMSVFNASSDFAHVATSAAVAMAAAASASDPSNVEAADEGGWTFSAGQRPLVRASPVGRGWARKGDPGGSDGGNLVAVVASDGTTVRFFSALLPYAPPTSDMTWMRYPMLAVTGIIVLFTMWQRCGRRSGSDPTGFESLRSNMPNIGGRQLPRT